MNTLSNFVITSSSDISFFYESIEQITPSSVLDYGMFLKRIGAISRQTLNRELPLSCRLDGIDYNSGLQIPVYNSIYNAIYDETLIDTITDVYDLIVFLQPIETDILSLSQKWDWISKHCTYAITNYSETLYNTIKNMTRHKEFTIANAPYSLIFFR